MRWRLLIEEYGPELHYLPGKSNVVADCLSRLPYDEIDGNHESFALDESDIAEYPLSYKLLMKYQQKDKNLLNKLKTEGSYVTKEYRTAGKVRTLITKDNKICVPSQLQQPIITWYHEQLCHPGVTRTELTVRQHFIWDGLTTTVKKICSSCHTCQMTKRRKVKYGHLPAKEADVNPWDVLCIDLIGPYKFKQPNNQTQTLWALTMIDPATGWFDMTDISTKRADVIANKLEQNWLSKYPWPTQVILDRGTEFMAEVATMLKEDYGITRKPITTRNPQANSMLERAHQTISNILRTFQVNNSQLELEDPWKGILSAVIFAMRSTVHTTMQATPMQLVFGRDAIMNLTFDANWQLIRQRKQAAIHKNNQAENNKRVKHEYKVNDTVLVKNEQSTKFGQDAYNGPWKILEVRNNGTVKIEKGVITDIYNIRNITPYK